MSGSSSAVAEYQFLPYIRRGASAMITQPDSLTGPLPLRATISIQLTLQGQGANGGNASTTSSVQVNGPGDVIGIDKTHVVRTEPVAGTNNFEPNYFPAIEFDQIDFPWLFTPGAPNSKNQLMPWLALVVLAEGEFDVSASSSPLPSIVVHNPGQVLPNLSELWAWAHVQISGPPPSDLNAVLASAPGSGLSRIICPRALSASTSYCGFLVPVFDAGQAAGLGQTPPSSTQLSFAWQPGQTTDVTLPVYYGLKSTGSSLSFEFEFQTSDSGDFESLVRKLQRVILPPTVGTRPMDVSDPDPTGFVKPPSVSTLGIEGALASPLWTPSNYPGATPDDFQTSLAEELDFTSPPVYDPAAPDPKVVPPFYGSWYLGVQQATPGDGSWLSAANLDPRNRAAAGMGAHVALGEVGSLLASAWKQAGALKKANQVLVLGQFSRQVLSGIMTNDIAPLSDEGALTLTAPVQSRITASPQTVATTVQQSPIPPLALSEQFRRAFRPLGPVRRRQQPENTAPLAPYAVIAQLNSGALKVAPPAGPPAGMTSMDQASQALEPSGVPGWLDGVLPSALWILLALGFIALILAIGIGAALGYAAVGALVGSALFAILAAIAAWIRPAAAQAQAANTMLPSNMTPATVNSTPPQPNFVVTPAGSAPVTVPGTPGSDSPDAAAFRSAALQLTTWLQVQAPTPAAPAPLDIHALKMTILTRLNPSVTVVNRVMARLSIDTRLVRPAGLDPLEPIMWAPSFPQPMYKPLADWSQELLLPGIGLIQPDTLALLIENRTFIESYMLGLNVEMGRQLLWNGFPTDQRGSYFRQFWDVSGFVPPPTTPSEINALYDIAPINLWDQSVLLGNHTSTAGTQTASVILLVRGELLKRYPQTQIYAVPVLGQNPPKSPKFIIDPNAAITNPIYQAALTPDLRFFGFNLTADMVAGVNDPAAPLGYFFVFQQLPGMPRFGLEPADEPPPTSPISWGDLSWSNFSFPTGFASPKVQPSGFVPNDSANFPNDADNKWGTNAAQMAYITMRHPERVAYLASDLLPPSTELQTQTLVTEINNVSAKGVIALEGRT